MKHLLALSLVTLLLSACVKEEVTKFVPMEGPVTRSSTQREIEGPINGGGGKGVRCQKDGVTTVETLDIYEGRVLYDLKMVDAKNLETREQALDFLATSMTSHFWNPDTIPKEQMKKHMRESSLEELLKQIRFIDSSKKLKMVNDSLEPLIESNCEIVQVAIFYDEKVLLVDRSLWDQMDWFNKTALLAHEVFYAMDRQNGAKNSISIRRLVAQMFSENGARPRSDGVPSDASQRAHCGISKRGVTLGYFYAYPSKRNDEDGLELVFNFLNNSSYLFRTSTFLRGLSLVNMKEKDYRRTMDGELEGEGTTQNLILQFEFSEAGKGHLYIINRTSGEVQEPFEVSCRLP